VHTKLFVAAAAGAIVLSGSPGVQARGSTISGLNSTSGLFRQMDTNHNGTVSKSEFLHFMSRRFQRLDTNHDGKLERSELRPLAGGKPHDPHP